MPRFRCRFEEFLIVFSSLLIVEAVSTGRHCINEPCMYGICVDDANSTYRCYCIDGYTGINCEINWDDCWSNPCLNGGTCNDAIAYYNCTCPDGFVGLNCEQKFSECMNRPCLNNGTCFDDNVSGITCQCLEGFSGNFCEIDATVCNDTVCRNFGECVEGPGLRFSCRCPDGWTGEFCDDDVDECSVYAPCQSGGLCINTPGSYTCACLFGYTGKDCDKPVLPCEHNPCQNGAVCLLEDNQPVCYCVPDYHGTLCEEKYDDCESKFVMCENGGTCVDGVNDFTCSCPVNFTGKTCSIYVEPTTVVNEISTFSTIDNSMIQTMRPVMIPTTIGDKDGSVTTIDDLTTVYKEQYPTSAYHQQSSKEPGMTTVNFEDSTNTASVGEFMTNGPVRETQPPEKTTLPERGSTDATGTTVDLNEGKVTDIPKEVTQEYDTTIYSETTGSDKSSTVQLTSKLEESMTTSAYNPLGFNDNATSREPTMITDSTSTPVETLTTLTDKFSTTIIQDTVSGFPTTESIPGSSDYHSSAAPNSSVVFMQELTSPFTDTPRTVVTMVPTTIGTSGETTFAIFSEKVTQPIESTKFDATTEGLATSGSPTRKDQFTTIKEFHETTFGTELPGSEFATMSTTPVTKEVYKCTKAQCANTSLCIENNTQCDCSYPGNCRDHPSVKNAAFNGKSYIRQKFAIDNGVLAIFLRLKTKAKSGTLVHTLFDDERYVLLYMENSQLKFQFSCGSQTMLFGELDTPINKGYEVDIEMRFHYVEETVSDKCIAKLLVNDTIAMSGEQVLKAHDNVPQSARLHLGGIPVAFSHQFPQIVLGFTGCINLFKINGIERDFVHDSIEAVQIEECNSFLCLANPCKNYGSCEESNGKISCKCAAGYSGETCEKSICDENPCHLGASCIASPGTNFICVCPLGTHGLYCEKDMIIMQPSFSIFAPGFSSYMAYGLTASLKDNMELKLRIMPHTQEQISLIAYIGQTGPKRDLTDYLSVTFVRGYLMLTWDLGSGVRRIFTSSPINVRTHRAYMLNVGRRGRDAWLNVEGVENVTGRAAGANNRLDVSPILYIGGHKSKYFDTLPHDLPLHTGFTGCIYDIELRTDENVLPISKISPATGRGVGECHRNECSQNSCKNAAVCLNHGPSYSCICMKDWKGADCSIPNTN